MQKMTVPTLILALLLCSTPAVAAASNHLLPSSGLTAWEASSDLEKYAACGAPDNWLNVTPTASGGVTLERSASCPDYYTWPRLRLKPGSGIDIDLLRMPEFYFDLSFVATTEDSGWMIQLTFNETTIIPLPQAIASACGQTPPADINELGGGGVFKGFLNLKTLIESYRPSLVADTYIVKLTGCDIILFDSGRESRLTVNALQFGDPAKAYPSTWAAFEVNAAIEAGLCGEDVRKNYQTDITRAQYAGLSVLLYEKLMGRAAEPPQENPFTDTSDPMILKAYNAGIVEGVGGGLFAPERAITRAELAVMLKRTLSVAAPERYSATVITPSNYLDKDSIRSWAGDAVDFVTALGIMQGSNNNFKPLELTSCEQAILTNYRSWIALR